MQSTGLPQMESRVTLIYRIRAVYHVYYVSAKHRPGSFSRS